MELQQLLSETAQRKASDLHLKSGSKPILRIHGHLEVQDDLPMVTREFIDKMAESLLGERRVSMLLEGREMDLGYMLPGIGRFRCNLFLAMGEVRGVFRHVPERIPAFQELHLPKVLERLSMERRGMILVTGITGSGKSTSLASMIDFMNRSRNDHIVTIEDPIEFVHDDWGCIVNQREVGLDTDSFLAAIRRVLRQDPDVILIGELRDAETAETALKAAESGHLVFSTLHTIDAAETIGRMIEFFPADKQDQIRSILAGVLRGVVSQRLLPRKEGGRVAAVEVMITNSRIADLIRDRKTEEISDAIAEGQFFDMQTFAQALIELVVAGEVDREIAANASTNRHDFLVELDQALKRKAAGVETDRPVSAMAEPEPAPPAAVEQPMPNLRIAASPDG